MTTKFPAYFAIALLIASLPLPVCLAASDYAARVETVRNRLRYYINDLSSTDKDTFKQDIENLQRMVGPLEELQSQFELEQKKVQSAQDDYDNATRIVETRQAELQNERQRAQERVAPLVQKAQALCGQMGGSANGTQCTFTCDSRNMAPCNAKAGSFDQQIAELESRVRSILGEVQTKQERADEAEKTAAARERDLNEQKSQHDQTERNLSDKKEEFENEAQRIEGEIDAAKKEFIKPKPGSILYQTPTAAIDPGCFDRGCVPAATLPEVSVPTVLANRPEALAGYNKVVEARDQAQRRAEEARKAMKDYLIGGGKDPQVFKQLYQVDAKAQLDAYHANIAVQTFTDLMKPVAPKPAGGNNVK